MLKKKNKNVKMTGRLLKLQLEEQRGHEVMRTGGSGGGR